MPTRIRGLLFVVVASVTVACSNDNAVEPTPTPITPTPKTPFSSIPTSVEMTPFFLGLDPGATQQLSIAVLDQTKTRLELAEARVGFRTSDSTVARVSQTGIVTAVKPGVVEVWVTVTADSFTATDSINAVVRSTSGSGPIVVSFGSTGWLPHEVSIDVGTVVYWVTDPSFGPRLSQIYLGEVSDKDYDYSLKVVDSVSVSRGYAARRFDTPQTIGFCSGGCWDSRDFGVIRVH